MISQQFIVLRLLEQPPSTSWENGGVRSVLMLWKVLHTTCTGVTIQILTGEVRYYMLKINVIFFQIGITQVTVVTLC